MKSSFSNPQGNCIEVERKGRFISVSETDPTLNYGQLSGFLTTPENFAAFVEGVKAGEFDEFVSSQQLGDRLTFGAMVD